MKKIISASALLLLLASCTSFYENDMLPEPAAVQKKQMLKENAVFYRAKAVKSDFFQKSDRLIAYSASFILRVKQRTVALDKIKQLAESMDGYMVSRSDSSVNVKIPLAKADEFFKKSGNIGDTENFKFQAEDLTDTITDINVRLENMKKLRERLTGLIGKSRSVEDILKIEKELNRVTTEIERLTAALQNNRNRVDFVPFDISVVEEYGVLPAGIPQAVERFRFLRALASAEPGAECESSFPVRLPAGMVTVTEPDGAENVFTATTSDDCLLRTWETEIPQNSQLEFWETMICRALKHYKGFDLIKSRLVMWNDRKAVRITARLITGKGTCLYLMVATLKRNWFCDSLQFVEFSGPEAAFSVHEKNISEVIGCR